MEYTSRAKSVFVLDRRRKIQLGIDFTIVNKTVWKYRQRKLPLSV